MSFLIETLNDLLGLDDPSDGSRPFATTGKHVQILNSPYARWKYIAQSMGIATYHFYVGREGTSASHDYIAIFCGNQDFVIRSTVVPAGEATWLSEFPSSIECVDEEECIVAVVGNFFTARKLGNLTATSASEVVVSSRAYNEQGSEGQRSIKSTNAGDDDGTPAGARVIRITYLTSGYVRKTTDCVTNGTAAVATSVSDIRFVESMEVIKGTAAVGAIELWSNNNGTGTAIAGIPALASSSFICHHYVPANTRCWVFSWGATSDDEASLKLIGQDRQDGTNLVDRIIDLEKLFQSNPTPPTRLDFERSLKGILLPEKTYVRVTVVPNQATSTTVRARFDFWEVPT